MGEVLIAAMSTLLIAIFLGPQFIRFLKPGRASMVG